MGELILIDKAVVSEEDFTHKTSILTPEAERLLLNQKILKDIAMLNHSCAPNAEMGLLDGEKNEEPEQKRFELRAVKNISKEDEVTIYYPNQYESPFLSHTVTKALIQRDFGFECKCVVCLGLVPNQDDIVKKIREILNHNVLGMSGKQDKTLQDWKKEAIVFGTVSDLAKSLYVGREVEKIISLVGLFQAAINSGNSELRRKTFFEMTALADKTGLEIIRNQVEVVVRRWLRTASGSVD